MLCCRRARDEYEIQEALARKEKKRIHDQIEKGTYKTGVVNDPLGHSTVPAGSPFRFILKSWNGQKDGWMKNLCENSDHHRPGLGSA